MSCRKLEDLIQTVVLNSAEDSPLGNSNEQGNMGGNVGGEQAASWNSSYSELHSDSWQCGQGPSQYSPYGLVQQGEERSSASGSYSYGDYGQTQYRYPPPPPPSSYDAAAFFGFVDPNAHKYQIQYCANRNDNTSGDEDNHAAIDPGRHSFWRRLRYKLETDTKILLKKADAALRKYKMHVVVANELSTRKEEVVVLTTNGSVTVRRENRIEDVEKPLIELLVEKHSAYIEQSASPAVTSSLTQTDGVNV